MTREQEFRKKTEEAKFEAFTLMCKKVADLEKENAELRKIAQFQQSSNMDRGFQLQRSNEKLAKAKDIIKNLIGILEFVDGEQTRELKTVKEAEQFLKEQ